MGSKTYAQSRVVRFNTNMGIIDVMLYDKTPGHRDLFIAEVKKGTYENAEFNRVIRNFVSQGGELDETILEREAKANNKNRKRFPAEIREDLYHVRGSLGAGRDDNTEKASYLSQIYFVTGKRYSNAQLDSLAKVRNIVIPERRRKVYEQVGGIPHLDGDYTIFGKIIRGLDVAKRINSVATNKQDKPLQPVIFNVSILK